MKAKLMSMLDTNDPSKELFGVKFVGLRRPIFLLEGKSFYETTDKKTCHEKVKEVNEHLLKNPQIEEKLKSDKSLQGLRL